MTLEIKSDALKILVVEDESDSAFTLSYLLQSAGYEVEVAGNGRAALEVADRVQPDVVLLDIGLPDVSGYEVATKLTRFAGKPPIIVAVTGQRDDGRSTAAGIDLHLVKPVDPVLLERLLARFKRVVGGLQAEGTLQWRRYASGIGIYTSCLRYQIAKRVDDTYVPSLHPAKGTRGSGPAFETLAEAKRWCEAHLAGLPGPTDSDTIHDGKRQRFSWRRDTGSSHP